MRAGQCRDIGIVGRIDDLRRSKREELAGARVAKDHLRDRPRRDARRVRNGDRSIVQKERDARLRHHEVEKRRGRLRRRKHVPEPRVDFAEQAAFNRRPVVGQIEVPLIHHRVGQYSAELRPCGDQIHAFAAPSRRNRRGNAGGCAADDQNAWAGSVDALRDGRFTKRAEERDTEQKSDGAGVHEAVSRWGLSRERVAVREPAENPMRAD